MDEMAYNGWAIVELFGHNKMAGHVTSGPMLRIDVPETTKVPAFTRFIGIAAIYALNPCDEACARLEAERIAASPVMSYAIADQVRKEVEAVCQRLALPAPPGTPADVGLDPDGQAAGKWLIPEEQE